MEWLPEREVDAELAAVLVAEQFPALAGTTVEPLGVGWDNTVHLVDGTWAFRFPRRTVALAGVRRETALLPLLAPSLPLAVPVPELLGEPSERFDWPFTGARVLPGVELADADLPADRTALAVQVGAFLRTLHDPELAERHGAGLPVDPLQRAEPVTRTARALPSFERLSERGIAVPDLRPLFDEARDLPPAGSPVVLSHGDLHLRHLLVHPTGVASGVIDWGDVCLADPCVDLSIAYAAFDPTSRQALLATYGHVDKPTELRARVLAACLCAALAAHAHEQGHDRRLAESLRGIARTLE